MGVNLPTDHALGTVVAMDTGIALGTCVVLGMGVALGKSGARARSWA